MKQSFLTMTVLAVFLAVGGISRADDDETNAALAAAAAALKANPDTLDLRSFQIISQRNIFNPNRRRNRPSTTTTTSTRRVDNFTLVGTMSYEKGQFAFFDGSSSEFRKTVRPQETIAGYKITEIAPDHIELLAASNKIINLPVGTQMRRPQGGTWAMAGRPDTASNATPPEGSPDGAPAVPSPVENDVMKRLMLKRLAE